MEAWQSFDSSNASSNRRSRGDRGRRRRPRGRHSFRGGFSEANSVSSDSASDVSEASSHRGRGPRGRRFRGSYRGRGAISLQRGALHHLEKAKETISAALDSSIAKCLQDRKEAVQPHLAAIAEADLNFSRKLSEFVQKGSRAVKKLIEAIDAQAYDPDEFFEVFLTPHYTKVYVDNEKLKMWLQIQGFSLPTYSEPLIVRPVIRESMIAPIPRSFGSVTSANALPLFVGSSSLPQPQYTPAEKATKLLEKAKQYLDQKNCQLAMNKFTQAQRILQGSREPASYQHVECIFSLATTAKNGKQYADALTYYNEALTWLGLVCPSDAARFSTMLYGKATCLKELGNLQAASGEYKHAIKYGKRNGDSQFLSDIYYAKGKLDEQLGYIDAALEAFQRSVEDMPHGNKEVQFRRHEHYADLLYRNRLYIQASEQYSSLLSFLSSGRFSQQVVQNRQDTIQEKLFKCSVKLSCWD